MGECYICGVDSGDEVSVCDTCATTDQVSAVVGTEVRSWMTCPLCDGSGRCFFCSPGGPCYHCSGSGREMPGSPGECHVCSGAGQVDKGCSMCDFTRTCKHCGGKGTVPVQAVKG